MSPEYEGLNLIQLLDLLEPTPEPPAVSMVPQTPGWFVVGALLVWGLVWLARRLLARHRANAYRRAALRELDRAGSDAARVAAILRRTALAAFPRARVAGLFGTEWVAFLDATGPGDFARGPGEVLTTAPYRGNCSDPALARAARAWVRGHRRGAF